MVARIQKLPNHLVNQIAAGEVIERPASVVKELVENAIDAGAVEIVIDVEEGGKRSIRVTDNGFGIDPDDLPLAVTSHATSKLRREEDLHRVLTLGFRGEALASMASVAELELTSRPASQEVAQRIVSREGAIEPAAPEAMAAGTRVTIRNLFYNVPARKRFLKSDRAELARIRTAVQHIALALPDLGFTLRHGDRTVCRFRKGQTLRQRVAEVLGEETAERMLEIDPTQIDPTRGSLRGFVGRPDLHRRNSQSIYTFLNGRFIRDRSLIHAVREAYRGYQIPGHHPVAVLFLDVSPADVDVNVHPAKLEVRFRDQSSMFSLIYHGIRQCLEQAGSVPSLLGDSPASTSSPSSGPVTGVSEPTVSFSADSTPVLPTETQAPQRSPHESFVARRQNPAADDDALPGEPWRVVPGADVVPGVGGVPGAGSPPTPQQTQQVLIDGQPARVFQVRNSFVLLEQENGLVVIDQHALHEKILYEEILESREQGGYRQPLLIPETVELDPDEWTRFVDAEASLAELGFVVEEFGDRTVVVRSIPAGFENHNVARLLRDVLAQLGPRLEAGAGGKLDLRERVLQTLACKRAVKAGQPLGPEQLTDLIRGRSRAFQPQNCPHGRPSELFLSWEELERRFDRK